MPRYKGTRYETMRRIIKSKGADVEKTFLSELEPAEKEKYLHAQPINWYDEREEPETGTVLQVAAQLLFPDDPDGLMKVGVLQSQINMKGIYRIFLKIPKAEHVIKQAAKIWKTHRDAGEASIALIEKNKLRFKVKNYPVLRADFRQYLRGYIKGIVQLGRVNSVEVFHLDDNPNEWKWDIVWVD